jgi:hypothetical protein
MRRNGTDVDAETPSVLLDAVSLQALRSILFEEQSVQARKVLIVKGIIDALEESGETLEVVDLDRGIVRVRQRKRNA